MRVLNTDKARPQDLWPLVSSKLERTDCCDGMVVIDCNCVSIATALSTPCHCGPNMPAQLP